MNIAELLKAAITGDPAAQEQIMQLNAAFAPHMARLRTVAESLAFELAPLPTSAKITAVMLELFPEDSLPEIQRQLAQMRLDLQREIPVWKM
jgi:hypothetical protein